MTKDPRRLQPVEIGQHSRQHIVPVPEMMFECSGHVRRYQHGKADDRQLVNHLGPLHDHPLPGGAELGEGQVGHWHHAGDACLLYTSDAADE